MLIACFIVTSAFSQSNLNDYKYVIVPHKFDFQKKDDQYRLNSLAKFLFKKQGFEALIEGGAYPEDLALNRCLALRSNVIKGSGMFKTKLTVELKNCNDQVVYTSQVGESRIKEYEKSYNEALRNAFKSFEALNYSYKPNKNNKVTTTKNVEESSETEKEIQKLKEELESLKKEKEEVIEVVEVEEIVEVPVKEEKIMEVPVEVGVSKVLYAQETSNGFQLVDSSPKVVYKIIETGANNVFLVENKSAIIYKNGNNWILEYHSNNTLKQETLNIKF